MLSNLPHEFEEAARRIRIGLPETLGERLTGVYVYGSALDDSFVPGRSDLDLIAVTETALDEAEFARVEAWLAEALTGDPAGNRIQMSFLVRDRVLEDDPAACLYQFGSFSRSGSDGNPIIWLDFLSRGRVLCGVDPGDYLPEVTDELLRAALKREVGYLREEFSLKPTSEWRDRASYRAYAVLTLCRILYSHATGSIASKTEAAAWAREAYPHDSALHDLVQLAESAGGQHGAAPIPFEAIEELIGTVELELANSRAGGERT